MRALDVSVRPSMPADIPILYSTLAWAILRRSPDPVSDPSAVTAIGGCF